MSTEVTQPPEPVARWRDQLSDRHVRGIFEVLDRCCGISETVQLKQTLVESMSSVFGVRDVTCFVGPTYDEIFADPEPLLTGATATLLGQYHSGWQDKDVFALAEARRHLTRDGFVSLGQFSQLPGPQKSYVVDYLHPNGIGTASAMHLRFRDGQALVGLFDRTLTWDREDTLAVRVLARHLGDRCATLSLRSDDADPLGALTPRQRDVARLVSEGLGNARIAQVLSLTELTVKKYVSRIFEATGCRNRSALTALVLRGEPEGSPRRADVAVSD